MRRVVTTLLILTLAVPCLASCRSACGDNEIRVPKGTYTTVVDRECYAVDRYGNPFPKAP